MLRDCGPQVHSCRCPLHMACCLCQALAEETQGNKGITKDMRRDIPSLDGIRAVAVSIVFLSHIGLNSIVPGAFGVTVFFFLSGYLITTLLLREQDHTGDVAIGAFFLRRFLRLTPPLVVTLSVVYAGVLGGWLPGELNLISALSQLFYFFNYFQYYAPSDMVQIPDGTDVLWSLSVEEHFYMGFVLLFVLLHRTMTPRQQILALVGICMAVLAWRTVLVVGYDAGIGRIFKATDTRLDSILYGSVLAYLMRYGQAERLFGTGQGKDAWRMWLWMTLGLGVLLICFALRDHTFRYTIRYSLQGLAMMPLFYFAVLRGDHPVFAVLNLRWMIYFGQISYTFYLVHYVIINAIQHYILGANMSLSMGPATLLLSAGMAFVLSLAFSAAVFHWVEEPMGPLRHRLVKIPQKA